MKSSIQEIPSSLIYEMVNGKAIYYKGYKEYLNGHKQFEEIMGSSYLQSLIITKLVIFLGNQLSKEYRLLTNEIGLQFSKNSWRVAGIAIVEKAKLSKTDRSNKYFLSAQASP